MHESSGDKSIPTDSAVQSLWTRLFYVVHKCTPVIAYCHTSVTEIVIIELVSDRHTREAIVTNKVAEEPLSSVILDSIISGVCETKGVCRATILMIDDFRVSWLPVAPRMPPDVITPLTSITTMGRCKHISVG